MDGAVTTLATGTAPDVGRLLRVFCWARLGLAQLLLIVAPLVPAELMPTPNIRVLTLALLVAVLSSGTVLLLGPLGQPRRIAGLLCLLDIVLVTAVVAATGGSRSIYPFLYVLSVVAASVLLSRTHALALAATASLLYAGIVFARTVFPITYLLAEPEETTALEVVTIFLNAGTFLVVAIAAGGLAEKSRFTRHELETQRRDLRDLQAFKEVVLRSVGTGLIVLDRDGTVTALNGAAEAITGARADDAIGRPWAAVFGGAVPLHVIEVASAVSSRPTAPHETTLRRPDGRTVPVRFTFSSLRSGTGNPLGLVAVCEDLSEIRKMEARMRQADRLAALGRLAANIAHEIRNPLASLTGAIEVLTSDRRGGEDRERLIQIIGSESERLNRIISDFLAYSRPAPLSREPIDVVEMIDEVLLLLQHRDPPAGLKISRELPPSLAWSVDSQQFKQALWNLFLNAIQAMPHGGELRVTAVAEGDTLRIVVADTGEGIGVAELPHVFEPFFSTKPGGSGLGLAMVHRIIEEHDGQVTLQSEPNAGTSVVLTLPGRPALTPTPAPAHA